MKSEILSAGMWMSFSGKGEQVEMRGEVVAIYGDFLCIRSLHIADSSLIPSMVGPATCATWSEESSLMLTEKREHYKPFMYPWAFEAYHTAQKMHWLPDEVPLQEDIDDWNTKLTEQEKNLLTQLFRFFTQADADIAAGYYERYIPAFPHPELRMMLGVFGTAEANHIHAYSLLLDTMGMPETEYQAFHEFDVMKAKHEYLFEQRRLRHNSVKRLAMDMAVFSAFGEGMQLFSTFAILLSFKERGLMKGMSTIIEWSLKDETHHVESMIKLFRTFVQENPEIWTDHFKKELYQTCREMVELEDRSSIWRSSRATSRAAPPPRRKPTFATSRIGVFCSLGSSRTTASRRTLTTGSTG
jgi:ribonucleotide reductase beta subunit family protein with ferritin-like domain